MVQVTRFFNARNFRNTLKCVGWFGRGIDPVGCVVATTLKFFPMKIWRTDD
jgi:hypothetical protein